MPQVRESVVIDAAPARVFAIVADPLQDRRWRTEVVAVERVSGGDGVGAVYRETVRAAGGDHETEFEVVERRAPEVVTFAVRRPLSATGGFTLVPRGDGCEVVFALELGGGGGLRAIGDRLVAAAIARGVQGSLRRLKALLERDGGA